MSRIWLVARREYLEHVRTRSFLVGIVLLPLLLTGSIVVQRFLDKAGDKGSPVVLVDAGSGLGDRLVEEYGAQAKFPISLESVPPGGIEERVEALGTRVRNKEIGAFFILGEGIVEGTGEARYYSDNLSRDEPRASLTQALQQAVRRTRFETSGVQPEVVQGIFAPVNTRDFSLSARDAGAEVDSGAREAKQFIPMIFVYLMFIGIMGQAQTMLTSTVEEKSNRVMEVLLSSMSPFQLMAGKLIGLGLVSLTLFALWMAGGAYMIIRNDWTQFIDLSTLVYFLVYFVPGFLLYASIMAAMGSVCTDLKEAQNLMTPMVVIMVIPLMTMFWVAKNPDHIIGQVLSFIPLFTPFLMINRISSALPPGMLEIVLSILLLVASIMFTVWLAARVFRVGVLLYGKQPTLPEVMRWLREA